LLVKAGVSVRNAVEVLGMGSWKKQRPPCNGADRGRSPRRVKRADFQPVIDDEKTHRTIHRRKSK